MLEAHDLECRRAGRTLFHGLSFALAGGELLRLAGENATGKTSLLRILCGLLEPTTGEVRWYGSPTSSLREEFSKQLVYLGHTFALKDDLTAAENLAIACRLAGNRQSDRAVQEALARFGLQERDAPAKRLSQGQRRRTALARLALSDAQRLWLLDEPYSGLDRGGISLLDACIGEHLSCGGAVVYTSHEHAGLAGARVIALG